jgi:glycosyltransferase involved in cell wall biosynthesis
MKILQVHNSYREPGGEDVSVATEAELLREAGHEVRQFLVGNPERPAATLATVARAPGNRGAAKRVVEAAREFRPDVVHVNNTWFSLSPLVLDALAEHGFPTVLTLRNYRVACMQGLLFRDGAVCTDCVGRSPLPGVRHRCYRGSVALSAIAARTISTARRRGSWARPEVLLALSETAKRALVDAGLEAGRIEVVPNAVIDPGPRPAAPSSSNRILFVGRLTAEKGPDSLLEAWRRVADRGGLELELIGDGPLRAELEREAPPGARFCGRLEPAAVRERMLGARALVFPSRALEPFGRGAAEAFAAGLPVLGSELGATAEIAGALGPRWLVAAGDPDAWAEGIARLRDGGLVDEAGARARAIYERTYSASVAVARLERAYERAVRAARRPAARGG